MITIKKLDPFICDSNTKWGVVYPDSQYVVIYNGAEVTGMDTVTILVTDYFYGSGIAESSIPIATADLEVK